MIKVVIFDLDNTLVDFMRMKEEAVNAAVWAMVDAGLDMTMDQAHDGIYEIYETYGIEYQHVFEDFLIQQIGEVDHKVLAAGIVAYRRAREAALVPYPHTRATLAALARSGMTLAVLSDAPTREAWLRLCQLQLHHVFDEVVTFDDTGVRKPAPEPFERVLALTAVDPTDALMIGDWPERDVVGARQMGLHTAFARYGTTSQVAEGASGADYELSSIKEIPAVVSIIDTKMKTDS
ncbi:MAG: HAD-IA family hydrolase [Candidatus Latescibacteria bacterium]|jgi:putative hydrolase of the HAD superfamily|nr:HAD-IA family hydrolase [Candidatus Latescibacterota bacterium]